MEGKPIRKCRVCGNSDLDPLYCRRTEVDFLLLTLAKLVERLGWPHTVGFEELVRIMVDAEMHALQRSESGSRDEPPRQVVASSSES